VGAFVDRYLQHAGPEHGPAVETYTTLALVRLVQIAWTKPERRPFALRLLELCEERLGRRTSDLRARGALPGSAYGGGKPPSFASSDRRSG
jgi:hypothetical protein